MNKKRKRGKQIVILITLILIVTASIVGGRIYFLSKPTTGDNIQANTPKSALLILDVQNDTLDVKQYGNTDDLMKHINSSIEYAQKNDIDILYTRQVFSNPIDKLLAGGLYSKNSKGSNLSNELVVLSTHIYDKERTDAFSSELLENHLLSQNITTLYIVGADASACVYKTALAGRNRGYEVVVLKDCIFSINAKFLDKAIADYTANNIKVQSLENFLSNNSKGNES